MPFRVNTADLFKKIEHSQGSKVRSLLFNSN